MRAKITNYRTETRKLVALPVDPENLMKHMTARKK